MPKQSKSPPIKNLFGSEAHRQIFTEIAYLKKRIHLIEGERKANYESNEEQLKQNEQTIHKIRDENQQLKKENRKVVTLRDNYYHGVVQRMKVGKEANIFRGKGARETEDVLECKIGDLKNKLNLLRFDKKHTSLEKKLIVKTEKEVKERMSQKPRLNKNSRMQGVKETENAISTMQLRITEAENVRARYKFMIETLASENFAKNVRISEMETKILKQLKEKSTTDSILFEAIKARKAARAKLLEVEEETMKDYGQREQKLFQCRGNLKEIRDKMEQIATKLSYPKFQMVHRDSSLTEGLYFTMTGPSENQEAKSQSVIEKVYGGLKEMTGESDPVRIISRFIQQRQHTIELEDKGKEVRSQVRKAKLRKQFLQDKLNNLQFCGGIQWQDLDANHERIINETDGIIRGNKEAKELINEYSSTMENGMDKLLEVCDQNGIIPPTPIPSEYEGIQSLTLSDRVIGLMKFLITVMEKVFEEQEIFFGHAAVMNQEGSEHELSELSGISGTAFKYGSMAELNLSGSGSLGKVSSGGGKTAKGKGGRKRDGSSSKGKSLEKKSDSSDDEEALTRVIIKRHSQVLVESKTRKGRFNPGIPLSPRPR